MSVLARVRSPAEIGIGDVVLTPRGLYAEVVKHMSERVSLRYVSPNGEAGLAEGVALRAEWLVLVRRAEPRPLPRGFFAGDHSAARP